jgi:hypothetical protein
MMAVRPSMLPAQGKSFVLLRLYCLPSYERQSAAIVTPPKASTNLPKPSCLMIAVLRGNPHRLLDNTSLQRYNTDNFTTYDVRRIEAFPYPAGQRTGRAC